MFCLHRLVAEKGTTVADAPLSVCSIPHIGNASPLVAESVVGEMNVVIEVRQIVVARWEARRPSLI